ncbi:uncharacterized protein MYCFIDRAFT_188143 [Pseudocercospora fijiensis CIRAD86]|uniref:Peptidase M20 dimerisation domain-containing protein n=1 Tax=Pseudocercospora fijiensis (strain CIRAD86) TaxID=383855 RepID=M3B0I9_PSEFD|nr:uncharacterized protein MYCFIDRAFT_188143 [Pseudocercospora fijiensis CIRAD86]EME82928.1 hypothetical protein MYCFIDRAFT_188143 [Pseudocercospora fijiensis CIRAD86]
MIAAQRLRVSHACRRYATLRDRCLAHDLISFHRDLVEIESISGNEKPVGDWLAKSLQAQGYNVEKQYLSRQPERFNVLAWPGDVRDAKVMLTSHIDTVPPFIPYKRCSNGTIHGRGSVDAKGSVAAQVLAVNKLLATSQISPSDVSMLFVVGEEVGGVGMKFANNLQLRPRVVVFGEPTEGRLVAGHKGIIVAHIHAKGQAAHSGYPWLGRSATAILVAAVARLRHLGDHLPQSEKYGKTTINLGLIEGGVALGVVAESASAGLAVRIADGSPGDIQNAITHAVHEAVSPFLSSDMKASDVVELDFGSAGYGPIDLDSDVPGFDVMTVNYGTDIPWLRKTVPNQKRYLFGPGTIFVAHTDHESLTEADLLGAATGYERIVLHALHISAFWCERKF